MEKRTLGLSEVQITPVIMGTWQAGKKMWAGIDDREIEKAVRASFDAGVTTFDTAEEYGWGHSERTLGKALAPIRKDAVIATKVFANHLARDQVAASCHRSLKRLQTDYIDLYQIHWPSGTAGTKVVPIEETMEALASLKAQGMIRAIGVSNFSPRQLEDAFRCGRIDSLQPPYSLFWRHAEAELFPYCRAKNITLLAYSPLSQGILTGKFGPGHRFEKGDHREKNRLFEEEHAAHVQQALRALRPVAERLGVTLGQLALAWILSKPNTAAVAGCRNAEQALQNAQASGIRLSEEDLREMDAASRLVTDHLDDNPVLWNF